MTYPTALSNVPNNKNFLSSLNYRMAIQRCPGVDFFCQRVNIPSLSLPPTSQKTPFVNIPMPGDKLEFGRLKLTYKVNESMDNYMELHNWLRKLGFPEDTTQYKELSDNLPTSGRGIKSDISVILLDSARNPKVNVVYKEAFPVFVSELDFDTARQDVEYLPCSAEFIYTSYEIKFDV